MSWHERPADAVQFDHNNWTDLAGKAQSLCAIFLVGLQNHRPIEIEARAAHHIGPEDLKAGVPRSFWKPHLCYNAPIAFVAHNSKFEASHRRTRSDLPYYHQG